MAQRKGLHGMSATIDTFPKSMKATRRMTITEAEFNDACKEMRDAIGDNLPMTGARACLVQWIIERVADGTILVEG